MKPVLCVLGSLVLLAGLTTAWAEEVSFVEDLERQGSVYKVLRDVEQDPELCRQACAEDDQCRAFTYYRPPEPEGQAHCWLQDTLVPAWASKCCVSGIKSGAQTRGTRVFTDIAMTQDTPILMPASQEETAAQTDQDASAASPGLDLCLNEGFECGWPVAGAFCARQGLGEAVDYTVQRSAPPTQSIKGGPICTGSFCHRIKTVTCAQGMDHGDGALRGVN